MVSIVGWGHSKFGKLDATLEQLIVGVAGEAMHHARIAPAKIDGIWLGHFNAGIVDDAFASSLVLNAHPDLRWCPATRVENACASGAAAMAAAIDAIRSGRIEAALVVGAEKMTHCSTAEAATCLSRGTYQDTEAGITFPEVFARYARAYAARFGDPRDAMAMIAAKNSQNALSNPLAQFHRALDFDFCSTTSRRNPIIADPLRLTDCSPITDGAAAVVLVADEAAAEFPQAVRICATAQVSDFLPMANRDLSELEGPRRAMRQAMEMAGVALDDLDFAELHDCFTISELMLYEALGLAEPGQGAEVLKVGATHRGGALPVNLSGGLKAKGHPVGATGVSMHVLAARQLTGNAGDMQVPGAECGMIFNMGGAAVSNYCSILARA
ncbi:MAG: thiolase domain-containing protein [Arenibacterium sp.]